jgi:hypothetical protein
MMLIIALIQILPEGRMIYWTKDPAVIVMIQISTRTHPSTYFEAL